MKNRTGFVSNSSSCSFIFSSKTYHIDQIEALQSALLNLYNIYLKNNLAYDDVFQKPYLSVGDEQWLNWYRPYIGVKGSIVFDSAEDNSIPEPIMAFFETIGESVRRD
jgi:hypothetical protein